jgi:hypothetical protein
MLLTHRRIHRELQKEAATLLGAPSAEILRYGAALRTEFAPARSLLRNSALRNPIIRRRLFDDGQAIMDGIRKADVTFIGDYHPFHQSQRTALRFLRKAFPAPDQLAWLGLEMISSRDQGALDAFQRRELSLPEFLRAIRYQEEWGFPWKNYEPLFDWARDHGARLIGLNLPKEMLATQEWLNLLGDSGRSSDLHRRDQWAAGIITDLFAGTDQERPRAVRPRMLVLYGELHIAQARLPTSVRRVSKGHLGQALETVSIHQNHEPTWWELARRGLLDEGRITRVSPRSWCVFTAPPWSRTQALLRFAEEGASRNDIGWRATGIPARPGREQDWNDGEFESEGAQFDPLGEVARWHALLAQFFELPPKDLSSLTLLKLEDTPRFRTREFCRKVNPRILTLMRRMVRWKLRFLDRSTQIAWLPELSANALVETASIALLDDSVISTEGKSSFERLFLIPLLEYSFGFLGSLILNPRRKCELPGDHQARILELRARRHELFPGERSAREIASGIGDIRKTRFLEGLELARALSEGTFAGRPFSTGERTQLLRMAARWSGRILAARMHTLLAAGRMSVNDIKNHFSQELTPSLSDGTSREVRIRTLPALLRESRLPRSKSDWF